MNDDTLLTLLATLHPWSAAVTAGPTQVLAGESYPTWEVPAAGRGTVFPVTFEDLLEAWNGLQRMFTEPDGAIVWVGSTVVNERPVNWQLDGTVYDGGPGVGHIELKGTCPASELARLLTPLGWPQQQVLWSPQAHGVYLADADFRRFASRV